MFSPNLLFSHEKQTTVAWPIAPGSISSVLAAKSRFCYRPAPPVTRNRLLVAPATREIKSRNPGDETLRSMRKRLCILLILALAQAMAFCAMPAPVAASDWEPALSMTAYRPVLEQAEQLIAPLPQDEIDKLLAEEQDSFLQEGEWKLPTPGELLDDWAEDIFPGPELPRLPELEELPPPPEVKPPPKIWWYRLEIGVNGAEGNSRFINTRTGAKIKRKTDRHTFTVDWYHVLAINKTGRSKNESVAEWRWETAIKDSPWSTFLHNTNEYDEFTGWDFRLQGDGGISYKFLQNETTKIQTRAGAGVSREIGGDDTDSIPEASAGLDIEHRLTHKQRLDAKVDYFPDVRNFNKFRTRMNGGWEIQIDEADHLTLRFSVQDRFDRTPDLNKRPNDFTYAAQLIWDY